MSIVSFGNNETKTFFLFGRSAKPVAWNSIMVVARRKLDMLNYAVSLNDLRSPPGNRLELLRGNLTGFYSIRINKQWRIVFTWSEAGPANVRICDYH